MTRTYPIEYTPTLLLDCVNCNEQTDSDMPCIDDKGIETTCMNNNLEKSALVKIKKDILYPEQTQTNTPTYAETIIKNLKIITESNDSNIVGYNWFQIDDIEFILIGEYHDNTPEQTKIKSFFDILKQTINNCPTDIDIFIEEFYRYKELMLDKKSDEYEFNSNYKILDNIRFLSSERNDSCNEIKIHACDIRNPGLMELLDSYYDNFVNPNSPGLEQLNHSILQIFDSQVILTKYLLKKQLKKINSKIVETQYKDFKENLNNEMNALDAYIYKNRNKKLRNEFTKIMSLSIDPYIILRMMKDYNSKIRIAYFGFNHIENIYNNFFSKFPNIINKDQYRG